MTPTKQQLERAIQKSPWDFSNKILYELCRNNFNHKEDDVILTKVLFIGRIYAAAIERRKNKDDEDINDNFYLKEVTNIFRKPELDERLANLSKHSEISSENIISVLNTHYYLTSEIRKITALEKRSFSSKYLHFHLPEMFYIYDSRAVTALREFISDVPDEMKEIVKLENVDKEYAKFLCKCVSLKKQIEIRYNIKIANRQFDNLLIEVANNKAIEKKKKK
ncbi:MAG: hypothetical protein AB9846_13810 [Tenuifilaceae bacterium]